MPAALSLLIDAAGMKRGAEEGLRALDSLKQGATATTAAVEGVGARGLREFQQSITATRQRGTELATTLASLGPATAAGIGTATQAATNTGAAISTMAQKAESGAFALRNLASIAASSGLGQIASGAGRAAGAVGALASGIGPLGLLSAAFSVAALGVDLFATNTEKAADELDRLFARTADLNELRRLAEGTGVQVAGQSARESLLATQQLTTRPITRGADIERAFGIDTENGSFALRDLLTRTGINFQLRAQAADPLSQVSASQAAQDVTLTRDEVEKIGKFIASWRAAAERADEPLYPSSAAAGAASKAGAAYYGPTAAEARVQTDRFAAFDSTKADYLTALQQETALARLSADEREREAAVLQLVTEAKRQGMEVSQQEADAIREQIGLQQQLQELQRVGSQFGASLANNVWDAFIQRGNVARNVVAGLLSDLSNIARGAFSQQLSNGLGQLFAGFGGTARQSIGDSASAGALAGGNIGAGG